MKQSPGSVRSNWERALLVCGKCSRKVGGGFGRKGRTSLVKALRRELNAGKGRKARIGVAEVKCLGVCPRNAVTIVDTAAPGRWHLIPPGTETAEVTESVLARVPSTMAVEPREMPIILSPES